MKAQPRCALVILLFVLSSEARGEPGPTPPIAQGSMEVPYPDGSSGDAEVTLELVVEEDGAVSSVAIVDGDEPFASTARSAASQWRFKPARREGAPVRARIRARVAFHPRPTPDG